MGNQHDTSGLPLSGGDDGLLRAALEGEQEAAWLEHALQRGLIHEALPPALRARAAAALDEVEREALLAEALEGESEAAWVERHLDTASDPQAPALPAGLRREALAAFDAELAAAPHGAPVLTFPPRGEGLHREPLRARRLRAPWYLGPAAAAALLLVLIGAGALLFGGAEPAEAGLQLRALSRLDMGGRARMSEVQPAYFAPLGRLYAPGEDELLSFDVGADALVVVGGGDAVRVATPERGLRAPARRDAVLRLEAGEARLATRDTALPLVIDGVGLLVLQEGAAHVALHAEAGGERAPAVALAEHSVARFHRADGTSVPLAGPTRVLLGRDGPRAFGAPARSLFRELRFFGGPLPRPTQVSVVSARVFEIEAGAAARGRQDVRILAPAGPDAAAAGVRLAWLPPPALARASRLRVALRAPAASRVALAQAGAEPIEAAVAPRTAAAGAEPGVATVELTLPDGWYDRLPDGRIRLDITVPPAADGTADRPAPAPSRPRRSVRAWFDGISLVLEGGPLARAGRGTGRGAGAAGPGSAPRAANGVRKDAEDR